MANNKYAGTQTEKNLEAAQRAAKLSRKGLWQDDNPVNPYDFRKSSK